MMCLYLAHLALDTSIIVSKHMFDSRKFAKEKELSVRADNPVQIQNILLIFPEFCGLQSC